MRKRFDYDDYDDEYDEDEDDYGDYDEDDEDDDGDGPRRVWRVALILFIVLLALVVVAAFMFVRPPAVTEQPGLGERRDGAYTLLVVGRDTVGLNTDTMMVCTLDTGAGTLDIVNIPRDTLVNVSWSTKKANSLLAGTGSIEGMVSGVGDLLGFVPDNYMVINMEAFEAVVDAIGGVTFDVPVYMDYDDPEQDLYIHLEPGLQELNGSEALGVFRWRQNNDGSGYPEGDIGRIATQQDLLTTMAGQCLTLTNVTKAGTLLGIFNDYVETDLEMGNLLWYGMRFLLLDSDSITFHTVPGNYGAYLGGLSYVAIYPNEWLEMVNLYLSPYVWAITTDNVSILTVDAYGNTYTVGR